MNSETGKANPADPRAAKMPAIPEDDLAHFEALVDRMLRDRAEAIHAVQEPLVDAPKITISHPAEFFAVERRFEEPPPVLAQPWHVRHARKLIGTGALVVGAGAAYLTYNNGWRFPAEPTTATPAPAAPAPVQQSIAPAPPAPTAVAEPRPAATPTQPAAAARKPAATPRPIAPAPAPATTVASPTGPRAPAVTHTLREAAPVPVSAVAAPAVVAAPAPAAAPSDCPENVAALGLCPARIGKAAK
jgi:hypothetical protein